MENSWLTEVYIIFKEIKDIGTLKCEYGVKLHGETLGTEHREEQHKVSERQAFGIRVEQIKDGETEDTAVLDFDESEEFCNAIDFMVDAARKIATGRTDYIEASFSTKDSIQFGSYQTPDREQKAFIKLGERAVQRSWESTRFFHSRN